MPIATRLLRNPANPFSGPLADGAAPASSRILLRRQSRLTVLTFSRGAYIADLPLNLAERDLCWTAAGAFDGFSEMGLGPWDMAARVVILEEAGAKVSDFEGVRRAGAIGGANAILDRPVPGRGFACIHGDPLTGRARRTTVGV